VLLDRRRAGDPEHRHGQIGQKGAIGLSRTNSTENSSIALTDFTKPGKPPNIDFNIQIHPYGRMLLEHPPFKVEHHSLGIEGVPS
jgi:hypothetical protein